MTTTARRHAFIEKATTVAYAYATIDAMFPRDRDAAKNQRWSMKVDLIKNSKCSQSEQIDLLLNLIGRLKAR